MRIHVSFSEGQRFSPLFTDSNQEFPLKFGEFIEIAVGGDWWDGDYSVTPRVTAQVLPVRNKTMREDVTVEEIPFQKVINTSGGYTAVIGGL